MENISKMIMYLEKKHSRVIFRKQPKTLPFLTKEVKKSKEVNLELGNGI